MALNDLMKQMRIISTGFIPFILGMFIIGCGSHAVRFLDAPPVTVEDDKHSVPPPEKMDFEKVYYYYNNLMRRPLVDTFDFKTTPRSQDVNSMDDVPASTWYTPRLGYRDVSPDELLHGVETVGYPEPPYTVVRAKTSGSNPGFFAVDSRGHTYLVKFDPPEFPGIGSSTALVVNRLFWGFGYNVPEDYLVFFRAEDLQINPESKLTEESIEAVFHRAAAPVNNTHRCTFSLFLKGKILGPTAENGVREDDPNDSIDHENRRTMRAMRIFGAFTNHADIRIDNSLDVYHEDSEDGYVVHYLLDFGEAFGGHGAEHDWMWDGFSHYFNFGQVWGNYLTLGLKVQTWENVEYTRWKSVGAFEAAQFNPATWRETYQFLPARISRRDDNYWAAKIISALTEEHIRTLVNAAHYPEPEAGDYIVNTLMERRRKTLEYCYSEVSPIEFVGIEDGIITFVDVQKEVFDNADENVRYEVSFRDDRGKELTSGLSLAGQDAEFRFLIPDDAIDKANDYLRVDILVNRDGRKAPSEAQFHFRGESREALHLVGVIH